MVDYKRILVPTDFSASSEAAIPHAEHIAQSEGAQILVAHVMALAPYMPYGFTVEEIPIDEAPLVEKVNESLESFAAKFQSGAEVRTVLRRGNPYEQLTDLAKEEDIELIVMSSTGHSAFERFFLGSVAEKVVRRAPCPVITVPSDQQE